MKIQLRNGYYYCSRPTLYTVLVRAGFEPVDIVPHFTIPHYHVWVFEITPELEQVVNDYFNNN